MNTNITRIIAMLLAALFVGCSKHSTPATPANPKVAALGIVEVSDGVQSRHDIGNGRVCIITPAIQKDGSVILALRIEAGGYVLVAPRVQTFSDRAVEIRVGDIGVGLTPHIKP